jgi:predicted Zn-dependent protease
LTNQKKINVQPDRIRVRTVKTAGILGDILLNFGVKQDELEQAALINGKKLSDQVEVNTLLKTVEKVR